MRRIALLLVLAALGCRRTHPPVPGAEPEPSPATAAAPANPAAPTANAPSAPANPPSATGATNPAPPDKRYAMPDGGTLNGDPRGPREADVKPLLDAALVDVRACFDADATLKPGEYPVSVHFFVEPPGYTGAVTVKSDAPKDILDCIHGVYEKLKLREFRGPKLELSRAFTYWKKELGKDAGATK